MENRLKNNSGGQWIGNLRGENGDDFINDTLQHDGQWHAFLVWEDCIISAIDRPKTINSGYLVGITIPEGTVVYGKTDSITLASGVIQAFLF
jgi:hypothetical protein